MKIKQTRFLDFLGMPDSRFIIPAYQRLYTWSESQCEELWLDILRAGRYHRTHFLGTILYSIERDNRGVGRSRSAPTYTRCSSDTSRARGMLISKG